jgi:hypothetical protein
MLLAGRQNFARGAARALDKKVKIKFTLEQATKAQRGV